MSAISTPPNVRDEGLAPIWGYCIAALTSLPFWTVVALLALLVA